MAPELKLQVAPNWDEIEEVRLRTRSFLEARGLPAQTVDAVAMVACELTENAVKYGKYDDTPHSISVTISFATNAITVEVQNPVRSDKEDDLRRLDRMVQWIRGFQDPFEAYLERLREVSSQSLGHTESGLGLVRIAYEGQAVLDFYVDDQQRLSVSAVYRD